MEQTDELEQAELGLIGATLKSAGRVLSEIDFDPTDFRHPVMEQTWRVMQKMVQDGKPLDPVTVTHALGNSDMPVDPSLIYQSLDAAPSAASASYYANIVTEHSARRRLSAVGRAIADLATQPGSIDSIIDEARKKLDNSAKVNTTSPVEYVWETMDQTIEGFTTGDTYIPTPWGSLNEIIGGLRPGAVYTVGARPGVGKSVLGVELGLTMSQHGGVAMFSLEMSQDDVNKRILANQKNIPMNRLMSPADLTDADYRKIAEWRNEYRSPFAVNKSAQTTIAEIRRFARNVDRRDPLAGIVVDYLQLMGQAPSDRRSRQEFVSDMSRNLKLLAMELNVPVVMLSQLNRESTNRDDKKPKLSDLRESGSIEQDSDVVLLLHRDIVDEGKAHELQMIIAKNRHGRPGGIVLDFLGHYSKLQEPHAPSGF